MLSQALFAFVLKIFILPERPFDIFWPTLTLAQGYIFLGTHGEKRNLKCLTTGELQDGHFVNFSFNNPNN